MARYNVQLAFGENDCTEPVVVEATDFQAQDMVYMTEAALAALPTDEMERVHDVCETFVTLAPPVRDEPPLLAGSTFLW